MFLTCDGKRLYMTAIGEKDPIPDHMKFDLQLHDYNAHSQMPTHSKVTATV